MTLTYERRHEIVVRRHINVGPDVDQRARDVDVARQKERRRAAVRVDVTSGADEHRDGVGGVVHGGVHERREGVVIGAAYVNASVNLTRRQPELKSLSQR